MTVETATGAFIRHAPLTPSSPVAPPTSAIPPAPLRRSPEVVRLCPWQMLCQERGATLKVAPMDDNGDLIVPEYEKLLGARTKLVAFTLVSNALGTVNPAKAMIEAAHRAGAQVLVDAAQSVPHRAIDVRALDCDFLVFSGHKLYGPTGIGVLYGKQHLLEAMPPWQGGGDMIISVTFERTTYAPPPAKFEAGTPAINGAIALGAAIEYVESFGMAAIERYEAELLAYAEAALSKLPGLRLIGKPKHRAGAISFMLGDIHPHDLGTVLDRYGVAIRAGHHCAQPVNPLQAGVKRAAGFLACWGHGEERKFGSAIIQAKAAATDSLAQGGSQPS